SIALNLHNLGEVQRLQGAYKDARATFERSLKIKREQLQDHPSVALTMTGLGRVLLELGEAPAARTLLEDAAERREQQENSADAKAETTFALARAVLGTAPKDSVGALEAGKAAYELAEAARLSYVEA